MSKRMLAGLALAGALGLAGVSALAARGQGDPLGQPFAGKTVVVFSRANVPVTLENVEFRNFGGRIVLTGRVARVSKFTRDQWPGSAIWVPWDEVTQAVEAVIPSPEKPPP